MSPLITVTYHIYTLLASFDHEQLSNFPQKFNHFLFFLIKQFDPQFTWTYRQTLRHGNLSLVLVDDHDHIISFRRSFVSFLAGSRYYFSLSNRNCILVLLLWFVGKLTRRWR